MANFQELREFERGFETMSVDELERWKIYWTQHAKRLAPSSAEAGNEKSA